VGRTIPPLAMWRRLLPTWLSGSTIGAIIGILPGAGQVMAIYMSYDYTRARNKDKEFGAGVPEGVAAPESANNAVVSGSMVPLLSLGVPGNSTSALFIGALMLQGLRPGPALFREHPDMAYLIIMGFFLANIIMGPMGLGMGRMLAKIVFKIPQTLMTTAIVFLCITGAYSVGNHEFYVWTALLFGVIGYLMDKTKIPQGPLILALILGPMMETGLEQSLAISMGSYMTFITRPICGFMLLASLFFCLLPVISHLRKKKMKYFELEEA
jgi:putative tricarboxylic transport membrane protein